MTGFAWLCLVSPMLLGQSSGGPSAVEDALDRLGSDAPDARERAFQDLKNLGQAALPKLKAVLPRLKDAEVMARVVELLRILEPEPLQALEEHLAAKGDEVAAINLWTDPLAEKLLPHILLFQVWKKGEAKVWKLMGFDLEKKKLFDATVEEGWKAFLQSPDSKDLANLIIRFSNAASATHASIAAYPNAMTRLVVKRGDRTIHVWVKHQGHCVEARSPEGAVLWAVDEESVWNGGLGGAVIRHLSVQGNAIEIIFGKHTFARVDSGSGKILARGSD